MTTIIHPYGEKIKVRLDASKPLREGEPTGAKQSFKNELDVNRKVAKYIKSGAVAPLPNDLSFGFAPPQTFHEALNLIHDAEDYFQGIPSELRNRFENDPGKFLEFIDSPESRDELIELGLIRSLEEPVEEPAPVQPPVDPEAEHS